MGVCRRTKAATMERSLPSKGLFILNLANNRNPTKRIVINMHSAEVTSAETCLEFSIGIGDSNAAADDIFAVWRRRARLSWASAFRDATPSIEVPKEATRYLWNTHVSQRRSVRLRRPGSGTGTALRAPWRSEGEYSPDSCVRPVRRYTKSAPIPSAVQSITSYLTGSCGVWEIKCGLLPAPVRGHVVPLR